MFIRIAVIAIAGLVLSQPVSGQVRPQPSVYSESVGSAPLKGGSLPLFPPRTVGEHVAFGMLSGAAAGLLVFGVAEIVIDHSDHSEDAYYYIGFPLLGAAAGAALGYTAALLRGAPDR